MNTIEIAHQIISKYPIQTLEYWFHQFSWGKASSQDAINKRIELELMTQNWIQKGLNGGCKTIIENIYAWGFNGREPPASTMQENFQNDFLEMMSTWSTKESNTNQKSEALEKVLSYKGIGIATVSKWICFIDQSKYAIYDSRVSIALSEILNKDSTRIFPIIGRRSTKANKYPTQDAIVSRKGEIAKIYILYLETLNIVSEITKMRTSQIEMALFMIGK